MSLPTRLLFIVFFLCASCVYGQDAQLLSARYEVKLPAGTIGQVIADIQQQTGIVISYSSFVINDNEQARLSGREQTVGEVLAAMLDGKKILVRERKKKILLVPAGGKEGVEKETSFVISGYVKDAASKEVIIGAVIFVPGTDIATISNSYGFYSIVLRQGTYNMSCAYLGYDTDTVAVSSATGSRRDIFLTAAGQLPEFNVTATRNNSKNGYDHLVQGDLDNKPVLLGENDVLRALQGITGVTSGADGLNTVIVRGGDPGQNLNLLDGVPLYYVDHFFGLTSIYNSEAIKSVDFYKGAFPARFGGRVSSVIDVNTIDGDMERWGGQFNVGLVKGGLNVEGPLIKNKSSILVSGRRTWIDALWRPFTNDVNLNFYDLNVKANYILNKNNRLYLSVYNGRDKIKMDVNNEGVDARWGNTIAAAKWNTIVSPKLFVNTSLTYSSFRYELNERVLGIDTGGNISSYSYKGLSSIKETAIRMLANWYPNNHHHLQLGGHYSNAFFVPMALEVYYSQLAFGSSPLPVDRFYSNEVVLFAEDEIKIADKWLLRPGLHFSNWFSTRYNYSSLQPRLYLAWNGIAGHTLFTSFTDMTQFLHLISNNGYGLPTDFWIPSAANIEPEEALLGTFGFKSRENKSFYYSAEVYYKDIQNITTYNIGKNFFENTTKQWEDKIIQGSGWSYGLELTGKKKLGNFNFLLAYTLSRTWRKFPGLNHGRPFPYRFDRKHNLKTTLIFRPSPRFDAAASWTYMTGEALTMPDQVYGDLDDNLGINPGYTGFNSAGYTYNYTEWNNYRLPPIHRLDIGVNFNKEKGAHYRRTWSVGVFNAYARKNVMFVELSNLNNDEFQLRGLSFATFVPYLTYKMSF